MVGLLRSRRVGLVAGLLALTLRTAGATPQVIAVSGAPTGPRTAMIVGQVVDGTTGAPVPEAIVQLTMPKYFQELATTPKGRVMADSDGRFFFTDLPAGDYYLQTTKDGYVTGVHGQRRASGQYQLLSLEEGERRAGVTLALWKYAVVGGTVLDEAGEPVVGVSVRALARDFVAGRARYGGSSYLVPTTTTDDRGMFRLPQMTPGTYVIVAPSTHTTVPASYIEAADPWMRTELFGAGVSEVPLLGQPRVQQVDDFALMTMTTVFTPPPASSSGRMTVYRTTFFPGATSAAAATPIAVGAGAERTDITITLRPVPAVKVSGRLVMPDGSPAAPMTIRLVGEAMTGIAPLAGSTSAEVGFETVTGISDGSGRFTLLGVPPGDYVLQNTDRSFAMAAQRNQPAFWISQRVTVGSSDVRDLVVDVRSGLRIGGTMEFVGPNGPQPAPTQLANFGLTLDTPSGTGGAFLGQTTNGTPTTFSIGAPAGHYIVRPYEFFGWYMRSLTLDGKDVTDKVFDVQADTTSLVLTFTDRPSKVTGTVRDVRGAVSTSAAVMAFPADPERWMDYGTSPRILKKVSATRTGVYTFEHLPAGAYNVVAIDDLDTAEWMDPKTLQVLASQATKVTIAAGDAAKTIDLTLRTIR